MCIVNRTDGAKLQATLTSFYNQENEHVEDDIGENETPATQQAKKGKEGDLRKFSDIGAWEIPSFDKPEPQPQTLPNCPPLDASLGTERGLKPPIKPQSPDSFRMNVLDNLTIHTPLSSLVVSFHLRDLYCYYRLCINYPKKHYGFESGLLGHSESLYVDFSKLEMIDDD
nr:nuclear export mediator factor NEMF isoform X1 [Tanacetum cinerariifolium]